MPPMLRAMRLHLLERRSNWWIRGGLNSIQDLGESHSQSPLLVAIKHYWALNARSSLWVTPCTCAKSWSPFFQSAYMRIGPDGRRGSDWASKAKLMLFQEKSWLLTLSSYQISDPDLISRKAYIREEKKERSFNAAEYRTLKGFSAVNCWAAFRQHERKRLHSNDSFHLPLEQRSLTFSTV